jgi:hypothetical protein
MSCSKLSNEYNVCGVPTDDAAIFFSEGNLDDAACEQKVRFARERLKDSREIKKPIHPSLQ